MKTAWGGNCRFHGQINHSRASLSPLSHIHHVPLQLLPQAHFHCWGEGGLLKHTSFGKENAKSQAKSMSAPIALGSASTGHYSGCSHVCNTGGQAEASVQCNVPAPPHPGGLGLLLPWYFLLAPRFSFRKHPAAAREEQAGQRQPKPALQRGPLLQSSAPTKHDNPHLHSIMVILPSLGGAATTLKSLLSLTFAKQSEHCGNS